MALEKTTDKKSSGAAKQVQIVVRAEHAGEVIITGDFTGWSEEGIRLSKDSKGLWKTSLKFLPGEYEYRLRVDGKWQDHAEAQKRRPNPFGGENCVLTVS